MKKTILEGNQKPTIEPNIFDNQRMEKRFQDVAIALPTSINEDGREGVILSWLTQACKTVFSVGFNLYETGVMDINKTKAYCSENVLRNLINFSQKYEITSK